MTISTPALDAIRQQLAVEQLALRDAQITADEARAAFDLAAAQVDERLATVASLEQSLATLEPIEVVTEQEPEGAA